MEDSTLHIIKQKDDWKYSVEIKENTKGETSITIKTRSDGIISDAGNEALQEYNRLRGLLK